jgi:hypothetical protein
MYNYLDVKKYKYPRSCSNNEKKPIAVKVKAGKDNIKEIYN